MKRKYFCRMRETGEYRKFLTYLQLAFACVPFTLRIVHLSHAFIHMYMCVYTAPRFQLSLTVFSGIQRDRTYRELSVAVLRCVRAVRRVYHIATGVLGIQAPL